MSTLSINIQILSMFLVGFRVQKKCNSKFHVLKLSTQIRVLISENLFFIKIQRKKLKKFARVTDEHSLKKRI